MLFVKKNKIPEFLIICGSLYLQKKDLNNIKNQKFNLNRTRKYLGSNYGFFRISDYYKNNYYFHSTIYTKFPAIIIQYQDYSETIFFNPIINNNILTVGIKIINNELELIILNSNNIIKTKNQLHLGEWQNKITTNYKKTNQKLNFKIIKNKYWFETLEEFWSNYNFNFELENNKIYNSINLALEYLNRIYDDKNNIHIEFLKNNTFNKKNNTDLYCLPTYEFSRLLTLSKIYSKNINKYKNNIENILDLIYLNLNELNCAITHNTLGLNDYDEIYPHTQFNTGLAGYPGGVSSDLYFILKFYNHNKIKSNKEKKLKNIVKWLELISKDNKILSYSYPTTSTKEELFYYCPTGPKTQNIGGTVFTALALLEYYSYTNNKFYLNKTFKIENSIWDLFNKNYFIYGNGLLRDAAPEESEAISIIFYVQLLINIYNINKDENLKKKIKISTLYLTEWIYLWEFNKTDLSFYADTMTESFTPRLALWDTLLLSNIFSQTYKFLNNKIFKNLSEILFLKTIKFQHSITGGITETIGITENGELKSVDFCNGITNWLIEAGLNILQNKQLNFKRNIDLKKTSIHNTSIYSGYKYNKITFKYKLKKYFLRKIPLNIKKNIKSFIRLFFKYKQISKSENITNNVIINKFNSKNIKKIKSSNIINLKFNSKNKIIKNVYSPIIKFNNKIKINKITKIKNNIKTIEIQSDKEKFFLNFYEIMPYKYYIENNVIYFDITLKQSWNLNNKINQKFDFILQK